MNKKRVILVFPPPKDQKITWNHAANRYAQIFQLTPAERTACEQRALRQRSVPINGSSVTLVTQVTVEHVGAIVLERASQTAASLLKAPILTH